MTTEARFTILISAMSLIFVIMVALLGAVVRVTSKWTRTEDKLDVVLKSIERLIQDKDKTHAEMVSTMRDDRHNADRRLRWLEETLWKGAGSKSVQT
jgi:hypothetical protein